MKDTDKDSADGEIPPTGSGRIVHVESGVPFFILFLARAMISASLGDRVKLKLHRLEPDNNFKPLRPSKNLRGW